MKGALLGIITVWALLGALFGVMWAFTNYPDTSFTVLIIVIITLFAAFWGWVIAEDRL